MDRAWDQKPLEIPRWASCKASHASFTALEVSRAVKTQNHGLSPPKAKPRWAPATQSSPGSPHPLASHRPREHPWLCRQVKTRISAVLTPNLRLMMPFLASLMKK